VGSDITNYCNNGNIWCVAWVPLYGFHKFSRTCVNLLQTRHIVLLGSVCKLIVMHTSLLYIRLSVYVMHTSDNIMLHFSARDCMMHGSIA
jgi:hypothetical protein